MFQDNHLSIKPVVFFQSRLVKDNAANMASIIEMVQNLDGADITRIYEETTSETLKEAEAYFERNGITPDMLALELRNDFSEGHCISANDNSEVEKKQLALNSLEDRTNPYIAVFAVDKLNEGWDVLNLFDIVRLYETRDGKNGIPGKTTIKEADAWKERFLVYMKMANAAVPVKILKDDNDYFIWGFHFYNQDERMKEFTIDFDSLLGGRETSIKTITTYAEKLGQMIKEKHNDGQPE